MATGLRMMRQPRAVLVGLRALLGSLRAPQPRENRERLLEWHFDTGVASYLSGRMAFFSRQMAVAGNHFHRAVEMFLKGYLCETLSANKRLNLRHDLRRTWRRFKAVANDPTLDRFDPTIMAIDEFERLRQAKGGRRPGIRSRLKWPFRRGTGRTTPSKRQHALVINDVDELVAMFFQKAGQNPAAYVSKLSETEVDSLKKNNPTRIWERALSRR